MTGRNETRLTGLTTPELDAATARWQAQTAARREVEEARCALLVEARLWVIDHRAPPDLIAACERYERAIARVNAGGAL